jgi:hypothetical protein
MSTSAFLVGYSAVQEYGPSPNQMERDVREAIAYADTTPVVSSFPAFPDLATWIIIVNIEVPKQLLVLSVRTALGAHYP